MSKTPKSSDPKLVALTTLILLQAQARKIEREDELAFMMVNETYRLVPYSQCVFWEGSGVKAKAVSGLADIGETSPYLSWLEGLIKRRLKAADGEAVISLSAAALEHEEDRKDWAEWCGVEGLIIPFRTENGTVFAGLFLHRDTAFSEGEKQLMAQMGEAYAHALDRLKRAPDPLAVRIKRALEPTRRRMIIAGVLAAIALFPVRISATVPAEVVAREPFVVSAPMMGVIKDIPIGANALVAEGDVLVQMEDTALNNEVELAIKALAVAQASYARASREAFRDPESKAAVAMLKADMESKTAELAYAREMAALSAIKAPRAGVAVFADKNALRGRPVQPGERIMLLADPADTEGLIRIPAERFLKLRPDIPAKLFLDIAPLKAYRLHIASSGFEPGMDADGLLTYKIRAEFEGEDEKPGVGLKGSAKVYGDRTILIYALLRRPLAALRRMAGV